VGLGFISLQEMEASRTGCSHRAKAGPFSSLGVP
jgi:hypothetical protein